MKKFFDDIKSELGKISWINKRENIKSTGGVVLVTIILGVFLLIVDFVFSSITELQGRLNITKEIVKNY